MIFCPLRTSNFANKALQDRKLHSITFLNKSGTLQKRELVFAYAYGHPLFNGNIDNLDPQAISFDEAIVWDEYRVHESLRAFDIARELEARRITTPSRIAREIDLLIGRELSPVNDISIRVEDLRKRLADPKHLHKKINLYSHSLREGTDHEISCLDTTRLYSHHALEESCNGMEQLVRALSDLRQLRTEIGSAYIMIVTSDGETRTESFVVDNGYDFTLIEGGAQDTDAHWEKLRDIKLDTTKAITHALKSRAENEELTNNIAALRTVYGFRALNSTLKALKELLRLKPELVHLYSTKKEALW